MTEPLLADCTSRCIACMTDESHDPIPAPLSPAATTRILDERATPLPTAEVWMVWREYEPVYACYATEDAAKLGTIDCWREEESSCPEYSWPAAGTRLELVAGDKPTGIYAIRTTVYGASQPADRAAVLRDAADRLDRLGLRDLATRELRRMADEAETGSALIRHLLDEARAE
ncbi:MAG TPA: hypothetical protein DD420_31040 [Streptomyces sp.]|nr:hypothetical protein [Streptomyces sp.]